MRALFYKEEKIKNIVIDCYVLLSMSLSIAEIYSKRIVLLMLCLGQLE